jgi:hypothetical protein
LVSVLVEEDAMPEDSSGPAEKAIYAAYDALVQDAFKRLVKCLSDASKGGHDCIDPFEKELKDLASALKIALKAAEKAENKVPKPELF